MGLSIEKIPHEELARRSGQQAAVLTPPQKKNLKGGVSWLKKQGNDLVVRTKDEISGKKQLHQDYRFDDQPIFYLMDQNEPLK